MDICWTKFDRMRSIFVKWAYYEVSMKVICVDDDNQILNHTVEMLRAMPCVSEAIGFEKGTELLKWLEDHTTDLALLDINMPDMNGIVLAKKLRELFPDIYIVFHTGYAKYAIEAFSVHADGFLVKPVDAETLENEIKLIRADFSEERIAHISIRTFGDFDVFIDGNRMSFSRSKSKELLAYLVDRQGRGVSRSNIYANLWEGEGEYDRSKQKQLDVIIRSLRSTLQEYGIGEILEINRGAIRVRTELIDCDMYKYLAKEGEFSEEEVGRYLSSYAWANLGDR